MLMHFLIIKKEIYIYQPPDLWVRANQRKLALIGSGASIDMS